MSTTRLLPIPDRPVPDVLRWLGIRSRSSDRSFHATWGEVEFGRSGWALQLSLFGDPPHFCLHVRVPWLLSAFIRLPFLRRFAYEPDDMMESWGVSYAAEEGALFCRWGARCKIVTVPWKDWRHISHEVQRPDGSWAPFAAPWQRGGVPDGRHVETYPYRYLLRSGEKQERTATVFVERRTRRLAALRWTARLQRASTCIDVTFGDEVGERTGSWKGGTIGCGYELRPGETARECLQRMEQERRFT